MAAERDDEADRPGLAVRRTTDRCFFEVEEVCEDRDGRVIGYVVEGVMWLADEVAETRRADRGDAGWCSR